MSLEILYRRLAGFVFFWGYFWFFGGVLSKLPWIWIIAMFTLLNSIFNGCCQNCRKDGAKGNGQFFVKEFEMRGSCSRYRADSQGHREWKVLRVISIKLQNQYPLTPASWEWHQMVLDFLASFKYHSAEMPWEAQDRCRLYRTEAGLVFGYRGDRNTAILP